MKKALIGIGIGIAVVILVYLFLPEGARRYVDYYKMQVFDKDTYEEIVVVQDAKVLNQDVYTYQEILEANVDNLCWTYDAVSNGDGTYNKTIVAYGSNLTLAYGEGGDSGVCQDSKLKLTFELDTKGGYNLTAHIDGVKLSTDDRDRLLSKMCSLAK